jgi:hypothetical protein
MNAEIHFGHIEDEPALTDVVMNKTELVPMNARTSSAFGE